MQPSLEGEKDLDRMTQINEEVIKCNKLTYSNFDHV